MSHEIEIVDGKPSMAYVGEVPWHGLGTLVDPNLTPLQMLEAANLNWEVKKVPAYALVDGKKIKVDRSALVRVSDNKVLDVVGDRWNPTQNIEAFNFFNDFVKEGDMGMHTAGALRGGQIVWALAKVNESFELFKGDKIDSYLLFTNPHKFGQSIDVRFTPIRVVCNNTLTLSLHGKSDNMVKVSHRKQFNAEEVKQLLGLATRKLNDYREIAKYLGSRHYTKASVTKYFKEIFPVLTTKENSKKEMSKSASRAITVLDTQPGSQYAAGTWWQAVNAISFMIDHMIGRNVDTRLTSAWFGANRNLKLAAFDKAMEYAKAA